LITPDGEEVENSEFLKRMNNKDDVESSLEDQTNSATTFLKLSSAW